MPMYPIRLGLPGNSIYDRLKGFTPRPFEGGYRPPGPVPMQPGMDRFALLQMLLRGRWMPNVRPY